MPPLPASLPFRQMLPGLHRVQAQLAGGRQAEYWYPWRGGPQILKVTASDLAALQQAVAAAAPAAIARWQEQQTAERAPGKYLAGLITRYLDSAEYRGLAERTRKDYRRALDVVRAELGTMEVRALYADQARAVLIRWRDKFRDTPKTADSYLSALGLVLQWAEDRGEATNPIRDFPRIYRSQRADLIWEPQHLALLLPHCGADFARAVRFACLTGLREGDCCRAPKSAIGEHAIVWQTGKSRGRRTVIIPITDALRQLLAEMPKSDATTILTHSRGRPWKVAGLLSAMRRAKDGAHAAACRRAGVDPDAEGADQVDSGVEHLRFHDFRGTAATNFVRAGLTIEDVAWILGWKKEKVESIVTRYVTAEEIALAIVERMRQKNGTGASTVKRL